MTSGAEMVSIVESPRRTFTPSVRWPQYGLYEKKGIVEFFRRLSLLLFAYLKKKISSFVSIRHYWFHALSVLLKGHPLLSRNNLGDIIDFLSSKDV